ncbi:MAG: polysaccharide deacetylase family protein [candidate division KSB1 bacterium]|nr:polysaccharide deacetylase family protein [candidate division KSB1 bacterium]MDZ7276249.1 polysaccharide deacetylase family protein [candidate division KSB1 bacterium]MDZ7287945.1 polysaccharide deacetylase family protein [candidate division KSB1 bacterium]MDZ7300042.1 polysaccharide deacetylase family protein [candidate division KSB1 bacterium]MDZ7351044.1 polysaccharide deacetylase family protein [candidate division KSB1 bacterium]
MQPRRPAASGRSRPAITARNQRVAIGAGTGIVLLLLLSCHTAGQQQQRNFVYDRGGIIRGDRARKDLALVFTGDSFAGGGEHIRQTLKRHQVKASFFFTGRFYRRIDLRRLIENLAADGHYLGAHSDAHLLYCSWEKRDSLLVTRQQFEADLAANYREMEKFGIHTARAKYFLPPYEWYNETISAWAGARGLTLVNFTPGTRTQADYTHPAMGARYLSSAKIWESIWEYERKDPAGLNGFILLLHLGADPRRTDKFYLRLDALLTALREKGYRCRRIDELLEEGRRYASLCPVADFIKTRLALLCGG